mmetsp:Transcript_879/g.2109  ORF Transcript_879/g.2109 Transcript_879/m.2109 type:complete len:236 (-) Transcript_879:923-1630(-)
MVAAISRALGSSPPAAGCSPATTSSRPAWMALFSSVSRSVRLREAHVIWSAHDCSRSFRDTMCWSFASSCALREAISSLRMVPHPSLTASDMHAESSHSRKSSKDMLLLGDRRLSSDLTRSFRYVSLCVSRTSSLSRSLRVAWRVLSLHSYSCLQAASMLLICSALACRSEATSSSRFLSSSSTSTESCSIISCIWSLSASRCIARSLSSSSTLLVTSRVVLLTSAVDLRSAPCS